MIRSWNMSCQLNLWVQQLPHHATTALPRKPRLSSSSLSGQFAAYLRSENPYFPCLGHVQPLSNASKAKKYQEVLEFQIIPMICLKGCAFSVKVVLMQNEDCLSLLGFMETFINMKNSRINQFGNVWQYGVKKSFNALPSMRFTLFQFHTVHSIPSNSMGLTASTRWTWRWLPLECPSKRTVSRTNHWLICWTKRMKRGNGPWMVRQKQGGKMLLSSYLHFPAWAISASRQTGWWYFMMSSPDW